MKIWEYEFEATFGDERRRILISFPPGGPSSFYVSEYREHKGKYGRYHLGQLWKRGDEWVMPDTADYITWTDIQILGDLTEQHGVLARLEKIWGKR